MSDKPAIMICGQGSRDDGAVEEFNRVATHLRERFADQRIESGFVEGEAPDIRTGLDRLAAEGARQILCVPAMLFAAPQLADEINSFAAAHKDIDVRFGRELAIDRRLLEICKTRVEEAEAACEGDVARAETLLMVVGRGTNDSDANSNVHKVMRMLWEGMGFGWGQVCYGGVTSPRVPDGLDHAAKLGFKRVIVLPYFLVGGVSLQQIFDQTDEAATRYPHIQFVKTSYLKDHPLVIDALVERVEEMLSGDSNMNCQVCTYREQIIVPEGGADHSHDHDHDHDHGHGHHHHHGHDHHHHHHHDHGDDVKT